MITVYFEQVTELLFPFLMQCVYCLWYKSFCLCCGSILIQLESRSQINIKAQTDCAYCTKVPSPEKFLNSNVVAYYDPLNILPENNSLEFSVLLWTIKKVEKHIAEKLLPPVKASWLDPIKTKMNQRKKLMKESYTTRRNQRELHLFGCTCQMENVHFLKTLCSLA